MASSLLPECHRLPLPGGARALCAPREELALGGLGAALVVLPFVLGSVWTSSDGASYEGLSWLQLAALLGVSLAGSLLALATGNSRRSRWQTVALASSAPLHSLSSLPFAYRPF